MPGTPVSIFELKGGDLGVQLAGVGAFLLAGLYRGTRVSRIVPESLVWVGWLVSAVIVASQTRGGMFPQRSLDSCSSCYDHRHGGSACSLSF